MCVEDNLQRFVETLKVRDQDFHTAIRHQLADLANGLGEDSSTTQIVVIAIHAGDDRMFQAQSGNRFGHAARLVPLDGSRPAFGHGAKTAPPGADVSQEHKGGGAMVPALADIGTLRRLTNGMQSQPAGQFLEIVEVLAGRSFGPEPFRLGLPDGRAKFDLDSWEEAAIVSDRFYMEQERFPKGFHRAGFSFRALRGHLPALCGEEILDHSGEIKLFYRKVR